MKKTIFSGITVLGVDEPIASDNGAFVGRDREEIDRALKIGVKTHRHDGSAGLSDPVAAPSAMVLGSGGTIAGNIGLTLGYTLLDLDGGETLVSETTLVSTPSPLEVPFTAPTAAFASAAGSLMVDTYTYALTHVDGEGGETPVGPSVTVDRPPGYASGSVALGGLTDELGDAAGWRLYRARGGGFYVLLTEGGVGDDEFVDDGSVSPDCDAHPPTDNINTTKQTNRIQVTLPGSAAVGDATFINLYASMTGGFGENSLLEQYPAASAGQTVVFESLDFAERQPPDTNRSYGGAPKIDPDVELLDWHWKRPVKTVGELPTEGNEEGDVRGILETDEPTFYMFLEGEWRLLELGGGSSLDVLASGAAPDTTIAQDDFEAGSLDPKWEMLLGSYYFPSEEDIEVSDGTLHPSTLEGRGAVYHEDTLAENGVSVTKFEIPDTNSSDNADLGIFLKWIDPENYITFQLFWNDEEGDNANHEFFAFIEGMEIVWNSGTLAGIHFSEDTPYWIVAEVDGALLKVSIFDSDPGEGAPTALKVIEHTLSGGEETPIIDAEAYAGVGLGQWDQGESKPEIVIHEWRFGIDASKGGGEYVEGPARLVFEEGTGISLTVSGGGEDAIVTIGATGGGSGVAIHDGVTTVDSALDIEFIGSGGINVEVSEDGPNEAEVLIEGADALLMGSGMGVIVIPTSEKEMARPNDFKQYTWFCKEEPENLAPFDIWIEEGP